jgi:hypothetical protein
MGDMQVRADVKEASIQATVIRADGTVEELGVVSYYHKNPLKRAMWALKQKLKEK